MVGGDASGRRAHEEQRDRRRRRMVGLLRPRHNCRSVPSEAVVPYDSFVGGVGLATDRPSRGRRRTAWLYVKYIRSVYYEQEHPFRYNAVSGLIVGALILLALHGIDGGTHDSYPPSPVQFALIY